MKSWVRSGRWGAPMTDIKAGPIARAIMDYYRRGDPDPVSVSYFLAANGFTSGETLAAAQVAGGDISMTCDILDSWRDPPHPRRQR